MAMAAFLQEKRNHLVLLKKGDKMVNDPLGSGGYNG